MALTPAVAAPAVVRRVADEVDRVVRVASAGSVGSELGSAGLCRQMTGFATVPDSQ